MAKIPPKPAAKTDVTPYGGAYLIYVAVFVVSLIVFGVTAWLAHKHRVFGWEETVFRHINDWHVRGYRVAEIFTALGTPWAAAAAVAIAFFARYYRLAWRMALSVCGVVVLAELVKHFVGRARPDMLLGGVQVRAIESGMGYPSVHTTLITVIVLSLWPYFSWKWRWIAPVLVIAVAWSRLFLGVHLPLDVVGGMALGTATVSFVRILPQSLRVLLRID